MTNTLYERYQVRAHFEQATRDFVKVWPLQNFIACNPLLSMEHMAFFDALKLSRTKTQQFVDRHDLSSWQELFPQGGNAEKILRTKLNEYIQQSFQLYSENNIDVIKEWLWFDLRASLAQETFNISSVLSDYESCIKAFGELMQAQSDDTESDELLIDDWFRNKTLLRCISILTNNDWERWLDEQMTKWLAAYLDNGQAVWGMPHKDRGFFAAWKNLVIYDEQLPSEERDLLKKLFNSLPRDPYEAITWFANTLEVGSLKKYLKEHLLRLPGWVGYMKFLLEQPDSTKKQKEMLVDYLLIRFCYEWTVLEVVTQRNWGVKATCSELTTYFTVNKLLFEEYIASHRASAKQKISNNASASVRLALMIQSSGLHSSQILNALGPENNTLAKALSQFTLHDKQRLLIMALEDNYRNNLISELLTSNSDLQTLHNANQYAVRQPVAQAVFCIDVRSEVFRKNLESFGNVETLGFAGFFGIPMRFNAYDGAAPKDLCPVLINPRYSIDEQPAMQADSERVAIRARSRRFRYLIKNVVSKMQKNVSTTFGYVETLGLLHLVPLISKTLFPLAYSKLAKTILSVTEPSIPTKLLLSPEDYAEKENHKLANGISLKEQVYYAEIALNLIGLKKDFAPIVVFCAHGAQVQNNPFASALDCGACGGNNGAPNARILAEILNNTAVRENLAMQGINIPVNTVFLSAVHNTVTDEVTITNLQDYTERLDPADIATFVADLQNATLLNRQARGSLLSASDAVGSTNTIRNAFDWSQVRPEWALAKNGSFIVAPRKFTQNIDLQGRAFLHSYDWECDENGNALEIIMTAPLIVAEWINMQYFFSAIEPERYGSGSKVLHNIVGQFGVMLGNYSDLQVGLPIQSLLSLDGKLYHEPVRLLTIIRAPRDWVNRIIAKHTMLQNLFNNEWVALTVSDPSDDQFYNYNHGSWELWQPYNGFVSNLSSDAQSIATDKTTLVLKN